MTSSYARSLVRKYKKHHHWAKKLPKNIIPCKDRPIDLGVLNVSIADIEPFDYHAEEEARLVGDGSWAIVYDRNRKGEWLLEFADNGWIDHICSECRYAINTDVHVSLGGDYNHCPRCGANMTKEHGIEFTDNAIIVH